MAKINIKPDCGNAPKKEFIRDFEVAFAEKNAHVILNSVDENIYWEMVGDQVINGKPEVEEKLKTMLDGSITELTIETIITHGDEGSTYGTMKFGTDSEFSFSDVFIFTSHGKDAKIKKLISFVIEKK